MSQDIAVRGTAITTLTDTDVAAIALPIWVPELTRVTQMVLGAVLRLLTTLTAPPFETLTDSVCFGDRGPPGSEVNAGRGGKAGHAWPRDALPCARGLTRHSRKSMILREQSLSPLQYHLRRDT
jgi:hypothetical protein